MQATGVVADGVTPQATAYQQYLTFLASAAAQLGSANIHDHYNEHSLWVSSIARPTPFEVWGDETLFTGANGGAGAIATSETAQLSQQALLDILATGMTGTAVERIRQEFPTNAGPSATEMLDLQAWNATQQAFCETELFPNFLPVVKTLLMRLASPRLGIVSRDEDFSNPWVTGVGGATTFEPVTVLDQDGRLFAGSNGHASELDPATGAVRHDLLVTGKVGVGEYPTRLATDGALLFVGVHGYVYGVRLGSWTSSWEAAVGGLGSYKRVTVLAQDGRLFASSDGHVCELDPASGRQLHDLRLSSMFGSGDYDANLSSDGAVLYVGMHGYVYALSMSSWSAVWDAGVGGTGTFERVNVLHQDGRLYAGSNGHVYELDPASGSERHSLLVTGKIGVGDYETRLASDGSGLYVGVHGYVYGVPLATWASPWEVAVGGLGAYRPVTVFVQDGRLYAGSNGYACQIDRASGRLLNELQLSWKVGVGDYDTRICGNGHDLFVGVHGDVYRVHTLEA
jgi:hypothetical protein